VELGDAEVPVAEIRIRYDEHQRNSSIYYDFNYKNAHYRRKNSKMRSKTLWLGRRVGHNPAGGAS
jgi:hypothetical protein